MLSDPKHKIWSFFDLDGTLIHKDSYLPFLLRWKIKNPQRIWSLLALPVKYLKYLAEGRNKRYIKEAFLTAFMKGARQSDVELFVDHFWNRFLNKYQNKTAVDQLKWHSKNGHTVYIVTASFDFYVEHLKKIWPLEGIIATRAEWAGNTLTGKMIGKNCKGIEKVFRIENELGIRLQDIEYYAYTDSYSDLPLLRYATFPVAVNVKKSSRYRNYANIRFLE